MPSMIFSRTSHTLLIQTPSPAVFGTASSGPRRTSSLRLVGHPHKHIAALKSGEAYHDIAGDTIKTSLSATFFYLSRNAGAYRKLADEIRSTFKNGSEINGQGIIGCQYLHACIDEALRMSPPAPGVLWREQAHETRDQPLVIDGHPIPKGTIIGVNTYSLHHNEYYFPDSFTYRPERWLEEMEPEAEKRMREAFIPFSVGPRGCAGKSMAYLETSMVIAKALWYFDFEIPPGKLGKVGEGHPGLEPGRERREEFQLYDVFSALHEGPYLTFKIRGSYWKDLTTGE